MTNIESMTPVEIDTELARIYREVQTLRGRRDQQWNSVRAAVQRFLVLGYNQEPTAQQMNDSISEALEFGPGMDVDADEVGEIRLLSIYSAVQKYQSLCEAVDETWLEAQPYDEEFASRGGWTRAFLVNNSNGHVHSSMHCATCYDTTEYCWMTDYSDHSEAEIVEAAGERACTVCYPSAPVEVLRRPTKMFTDDEKAAQQAREERATAKAERDAAQITTMVYDHGSYLRTKVFKSERAVTNYIAGMLGSLTWYGMTHPSAPEWEADVTACRQALTDKGIVYDYDKALAAARKKVTREGGQAKY